MAPRVAVVGAGALGLMAMKNLKEDGFDVTGYESRGYVGGLWKYSDDSSLSVQETTIFNSSRFRSAISDFPFPEDTDDYPTADQMHQYLESYCDHFDLRSRINLNTRVIGLKREGQQWALEVAPMGSAPKVDYFHKVVVATGSFSTPKAPALEGLDMFKGEALHAINYHQPSRFKGQNILMIGLHATSQDVSVSLFQNGAKKVFASHKNGIVMIPRYAPGGATFDQLQSLGFMFLQTFLIDWFPNLFTWLFDKLLIRASKQAYPNVPEKWKFDPPPSIATTAPLVADEIYPLLESSFVEPVAGVHQITGPSSVVLTDGRLLTNIDTIIYCTGYDFSIPFLPPEYNPYPHPGAVANLYRGIFPLHPDPAIRNSLTFLGQAAIAFPGFVQYELIVMALSQIWLGKACLPSLPEMQKWHATLLRWRHDTKARQKIQSTFYVVFMPMADHIRWLDRIAGTGLFSHFGWFSLRAWGFWWRDKELYRKCMSGLFSPAIWRLFDEGKRRAWLGARSQIFQDNDRAERQVRERKEMLEKEKGKNKVI